MTKRFVSIWFPHLLADWIVIRRPEMKGLPFVLAAPDHGRMVITAASTAATTSGVTAGMTVADGRAFVYDLQVMDHKPERAKILLTKLARWLIRFTPIAAVDGSDGVLMDVSGCPHLWGGEKSYCQQIVDRLKAFGYQVRLGIADTIGAAWAAARFGRNGFMPPGEHTTQVLKMPVEGLRLEALTLNRLQRLGFDRVHRFATISRKALRRRFGDQLLLRLDQAMGHIQENITPISIPEPYCERMACLEPIMTRKGIELALAKLLDAICKRLQQDAKGVRSLLLQTFRIDGHTQQLQIGTSHPSCNPNHLFHLFEEKISTVAPGLGIEVFELSATSVEPFEPAQEQFWSGQTSLLGSQLGELIDRLTNRLGGEVIRRYLPQQHYWPERAFKIAQSLKEVSQVQWRLNVPRPTITLPTPEPIDVMAPVPDYPPIQFRYNGQLHRVKCADGPERIECEWWMDQGQHRDYYAVEDDQGGRYWVFRLGHYDAAKTYGWYIHGFFA